MLLVDDDQADIGQRRQHREPRPDDDIDVAVTDPSPFVGPLAIAETGVDQRDAGVEVGPDPIDQGQRQRDLRDQQQRRRPASSAEAMAST